MTTPGAHTTPPLPNTGMAMPLLTGTITRYALLVVNIGLGVFLMPFTVGKLGTSDYGLWMMVASMTAYFQLLDLGYGSGLVRHVTEADARNDIAGVNRIISTFVVVYGSIALVAAAGLASLVLFVLPRFPNLTPTQLRTGQLVLAMFGLRMVVGFPMSVFGAVTTARQRFALNNMVSLALALTNGAITYLVLSAGHGLVTLVACTTAAGLAGYVAYAWTARQAFPALAIHPSLFDRTIVREVTTFSVYFFLIDIAVQIGFNLDNLVIGGFIGTAAVAIYAVSLRIADYQRQLCNQFNGLLFPVIVRLGTVGRAEALRTTLVEGTRIALVLVVGVTVCVIGFATPLVRAWMGSGFLESVPPLIVLAITGVVLVGQGPLGNVLLGTGRHRLVAFASLAEALVNLALSLVLVRPYGILGVALGTGIPVVVVNLFVLLPAACRAVGMGIGEFAALVLPAPIVGALPAIAACAALRTWVPPHTLLGVVAEGAGVGLVYLAGAALGLKPEARARYWQHASHLVSLARLRPVAVPRGTGL